MPGSSHTKDPGKYKKFLWEQIKYSTIYKTQFLRRSIKSNVSGTVSSHFSYIIRQIKLTKSYAESSLRAPRSTNNKLTFALGGTVVQVQTTAWRGGEVLGWKARLITSLVKSFYFLFVACVHSLCYDLLVLTFGITDRPPSVILLISAHFCIIFYSFFTGITSSRYSLVQKRNKHKFYAVSPFKHNCYLYLFCDVLLNTFIQIIGERNLPYIISSA